MKIRIYSRASWGARYRAGFGSRSVGNLRVFKHHTVMTHLSPDATVAEEKAEMRRIEAVGQARFGGGISYTFIIFPSGRIYEGTGISRIGAHTGGYNTVGAAICWAGNYEVHKPTKAQINSTADLLRYGISRWWQRSFKYTGHRDMKATACPGRYAYATMDDEKAMSLVSGGGGSSAGGGGSKPKPKPEPKPTSKKRKPHYPGTLRYDSNHHSRGEDVGYWQDVLIFHGANITKDNSYGANTKAETKQWQKARGLKPDGVVGPATWSRALTSDYDARLRQGDDNVIVAVLQVIARVKVDEKFGPNTAQATGEVQRQIGVTPDEVVGPDTVNGLVDYWS